MSQTGLVSTEQQRASVLKWLGTGSINLFGRPFAGKDTQLSRLQAWTHGIIVGGGEISRQVIDQLSPEARRITEAGGWIPIDEFLRMVTPYLARQELAGHSLLLSGVGRWNGEQEGIMRAAKESGHETLAVVLLDLEEQEVWKRWELMSKVKDREVRVDDAKEGLANRLKEWRTKTLAVLDYYRERDLLIEVDGRKTPDQVEADILHGLYQKATAANHFE